MAHELLVDVRDHVMTVTINRPEARNAMNMPVLAGLCRAWMRLRDDADVWVAILTGAGDKAFCSGGDLKQFISQTVGKTEQIRRGEVQFDWGPDVDPSDLPPNATTFAVLRNVDLWKPIIGAVNGFCTAGGLEMLQNTDIRVASENASFGIFEPKWGLFPGGGSTANLVRQIPFSRAMELLITGRLMKADEALRCGLVSQVVPPATLMDTARALADDICSCGPLAVQAIKRSVQLGLRTTLAEHYKIESDLSSKIFMTEDAAEGLAAFREKRKPRWKLR
ncbi:MAG TPA: enoyl-CoA hydratase-related protein [Candidatus Eisenbacteria bacterium]|nr:enoyl-CoA hydratase-related protein [Candidatus Eisenbacteria bacterium]